MNGHFANGRKLRRQKTLANEVDERPRRVEDIVVDQTYWVSTRTGRETLIRVVREDLDDAKKCVSECTVLGSAIQQNAILMDSTQ